MARRMRMGLALVGSGHLTLQRIRSIRCTLLHREKQTPLPHLMAPPSMEPPELYPGRAHCGRSISTPEFLKRVTHSWQLTARDLQLRLSIAQSSMEHLEVAAAIKAERCGRLTPTGCSGRTLLFCIPEPTSAVLVAHGFDFGNGCSGVSIRVDVRIARIQVHQPRPCRANALRQQPASSGGATGSVRRIQS